LLGVVHAQATDHINFRRIVPVTFLVVMDSLELIRLLLVKVSHLGKDFRVRWHLGDEDVVPFQSLTSHTDQLVHVSDLVDDFITVGDYSV